MFSGNRDFNLPYPAEFIQVLQISANPSQPMAELYISLFRRKRRHSTITETLLSVGARVRYVPAMNRLSRENQADILEDMMERKSLRGLARTARGNSKTRRKGVSINTVLKLLEDAGDAAIEFLDNRMRQLPSRYVEADEVYCVVKINTRTIKNQKSKKGQPTRKKKAQKVPDETWAWFAIDAESRLIVAFHVGGHKAQDAVAFMKDLSGRFEGRIQLTTDSLPSYPDAVADAFDEIDYAMVKKEHKEETKSKDEAPRARKGSEQASGYGDPPTHVLGHPDNKHATTNHIEVFFSQLRRDLARLSRRSTTISKNRENLRRCLALYVFRHNFIKWHYSLRARTPAEASGIDDAKWEWMDFIDILDDFRLNRRKAKSLPLLVPDPPKLPVSPEGGDFCVYHVRKTAKLHRATCVHLRTAPERAGVKGYGAKHFCEEIESARTLAEELAPGRVTECRVCLGEYNSKDYLGPRR